MRIPTAKTLVTGIGLLLILSPVVASPISLIKADDASKRVKIVGGGLELTNLTPTAAQCGKQNGETLLLKVLSETPIDVRIYVQTGYRQWINKDFINQKKGDEITYYRCNQKPNYKIYSHAVGSTDPWPQP